VDLRPGGLLHRQPVSIRLQAPRQHELRLIFLLRYETNDVFVQSRRCRFGFDIRDETVPVLCVDNIFEDSSRRSHDSWGLRFLSPETRYTMGCPFAMGYNPTVHLRRGLPEEIGGVVISFSFHEIVCVFGWVALFRGKCSASTRWAASGD